MAAVLWMWFGLGVLDFIVSYDIACKYSVNFVKRVTEEFRSEEVEGQQSTRISPGRSLLPASFFESASVKWLIGKFHLGSHRDECLKEYSFNFTRGVGRMSGELVETIWAYFDYLKYQTREMSEGARKELLTDAMNWWNWQKLVKIGV